MRNYTDNFQSMKLAEILPIKSADMCLTFANNMWNPVCDKAEDIYQLQKDCYKPDYTKDDYVDFDEFEPKVIPAWSLSALLSLMICPRLEEYIKGIWHLTTFTDETLRTPIEIQDCKDPIDACVAMIEKLHKLKKL